MKAKEAAAKRLSSHITFFATRSPVLCEKQVGGDCNRSAVDPAISELQVGSASNLAGLQQRLARASFGRVDRCSGTRLHLLRFWQSAPDWPLDPPRRRLCGVHAGDKVAEYGLTACVCECGARMSVPWYLKTGVLRVWWTVGNLLRACEPRAVYNPFHEHHSNRFEDAPDLLLHPGPAGRASAAGRDRAARGGTEERHRRHWRRGLSLAGCRDWLARTVSNGAAGAVYLAVRLRCEAVAPLIGSWLGRAQ